MDRALRWFVFALTALMVACSAEGPAEREPDTLGRTSEALAPAFPLKLSANGRYLVDQNNAPFLINQASSWGLIQALSNQDANDYLDALKQRGFNTVMVSIISYDTRFAGGPPNWQGTPPFTTQWDYSTYNDAYFAHADQVINMARDKGMLVTLVVSYLGYAGDANQGWFDEMLSSNNSVTKSQAYGRYLGLRYKNFNNIVWIMGGDNRPAAGSELENRLKAIVDGVKENDSHLWTAHWEGGYFSSDAFPSGMMLTDNASFASYIGLNGYYAYNPSGPPYVKDLGAYNQTPTLPYFHLDQSYETGNGSNEPQGEPVNIRRKAYQAMLMGSAGSSFNAGAVWYLFFDWRTHMDTTGTKETQIWNNLFQSRPWNDLVPDQNHTVVTAGYGTFGSSDYTTAARTSSGSTVMAFLPSSHQVTVDMTKISGTQANAWWFNPTNGQATLIGTFATTGTRNFTPSSGDWLLVLDNAALNLPPPGSTGSSNAAPTVQTAAAANPNPVTNSTTTLSVLGADDGGEPALSYTWAAIGSPPGPVSFSTNSSNAAKTTTATFSQSGSYTLQVTISDAQGLSVTSSVAVTVNGSTSTSVYRLNSGGGAVSPFAADQYFSGGTSFSTGTAVTTTGVANAAPAAVYQSERYGNMTYTLPGLTAGASTTVRLHFAEIYFNSANSRLFNVSINGAQVLSNFDVFATAGASFKAVVRDFATTANSSGQVVITFTTVRDNAKVSGIEVFAAGGTTSQPPSVATPAAANPNPVSGTTTNLSVLGADDGGEPALSYTWATTGTPPAAVSFSANGSNAAKNTNATFTKAGSYSLQATIRDADNLTATSSVNVSVNQTLTSVAVSPASASVAPSATQQFTGSGSDQFGALLGTQPTFAWSVSGCGTISSAGLFTAGSSAAGPCTVTATSGGKSGTASVSVGSTTTYLFRLNAGGGALSPFATDGSFSGGNTYSTGTAVSVSGVANAAPAGVYQSERFGNFSYTLGGLTAGTGYTVRLHFAEIYWTAANSRLFNVSINGTQVLSSFDIYAAAGGAFQAVVRDFAATANSSGQVVITFSTVKDNAKLSGLEIFR